jgi:hemoglobin
MKRDIENIEDIKLFVNEFYKKVQLDPELAPIFSEYLPGDWGPHLQTMYKFWSAALFGTREYPGNPLMKHTRLAVRTRHFERWIDLFNQTLDEHFAGRLTEEAKRRATIIAHSMYNRINKRMSSL